MSKQQFQITKNYVLEVPENVTVSGFGKSGLKWCNAEDDDLISIISFLKHKHPKWKDKICHIPNESAMSVQGRVRAKQKGLLAGAPDILILTVPLIAIELKREDYKVALKGFIEREHLLRQLRILEAIANDGGHSALVFGYSGFMEYYESTLKELLD